MKRCLLSLLSFLTLPSWHVVLMLQCGEQEYENSEGLCVPCLQCPPGQGPDRICGHGKGAGMECRACSPGTFSDSYGMGSCVLHILCAKLKRVFETHGTATANSQCGECLPGFYNPAGESIGVSECLPCTAAPKDTIRCSGFEGFVSRVQRSKREIPPTSNSTRDGKSEENTVEYAVFAVIPIFCLTGLLGILFCNFLTKKGYRCTSEKEADEEAAKAGNNNTFGPEDNNEDTIGVLVRLITEKRENAAALEELLKEHQNKEELAASLFAANKLQALPPLTRLPHICRHHNHLHTVQAPAVGTCCTRCSQKKWPEILLCPEVAAATATAIKPVKPVTKSTRPGEVTLLSVGRFRVARIPEQKQNSTEEESHPESGDRDSKDVTQNAPVEENSLLRSAPKPKWLKPSEVKLKTVNGGVI